MVQVGKKCVDLTILPQWQRELLRNPLVDVWGFLHNYTKTDLVRLAANDVETFLYFMNQHVKFDSSEISLFRLDYAFEGFQSIDIYNNNLLNYWLHYYDGDFYLFEQRMSGARYCIYRIGAEQEIFLWNDNYGVYEIAPGKHPYAAMGECMGIRLRDVDFAHSFLQNLFGHDIKRKTTI